MTVLQRRCRASELGHFASGNPAWRSADAPLDAGNDRRSPKTPPMAPLNDGVSSHRAWT